jgi:hypothetical protein
LAFALFIWEAENGEAQPRSSEKSNKAKPAAPTPILLSASRRVMPPEKIFFLDIKFFPYNFDRQNASKFNA